MINNDIFSVIRNHTRIMKLAIIGMYYDDSPEKELKEAIYSHISYLQRCVETILLRNNRMDILTCFGKIKESVPLLFGEWKGDEEKKNEVLLMFDDLIEKLREQSCV